MTASAAPKSGRYRPAGEAGPPIRLLIVDDSPVARAVLTRMVGAQQGFEVAAAAGNAAEALSALRSVRVDIVLLDLEMPGMSGLEALPEILKAGGGARVLVVSSLCERGAEATVRALALGAADTLPKPGTGAFAGRFAEVLVERLRRIGRVGGEAGIAAGAAEEPTIRLRAMPDAPLGCVAIGASTGGLHAISEFLRALPPKIGVPIFVTQHLPPLFMPFFARQIEAACGRATVVGEEGGAVTADRIHVAPGDAHLVVERQRIGVSLRLSREQSDSGCLPSVDPMLASVAEVYGVGGVGVILSGIGRDGLSGARRVVDCGGAMLAQDRRSAAVWGMPRGVAEAGLASAVLSPADLATRVAARTASWN